jgi:hypothetical protein
MPISERHYAEGDEEDNIVDALRCARRGNLRTHLVALGVAPGSLQSVPPHPARSNVTSARMTKSRIRL